MQECSTCHPHRPGPGSACTAPNLPQTARLQGYEIELARVDDDEDADMEVRALAGPLNQMTCRGIDWTSTGGRPKPTQWDTPLKTPPSRAFTPRHTRRPFPAAQAACGV